MNSINHYNPQFRGLSLSKYNKEARIAASEFIANVTHQDAKDVIKLTKTAGQKKIGFFKQLADKYNKDNYYRTPAERESSSLVNQIFTNVTNPGSIHNRLIYEFNGSMEALGRIFSGTRNKTKRIAFAYQVNRDVIGEHRHTYENLIPELLESENSKKYVSNFAKYKSYLKLHRNESDAVKNLDKMVSDGTYNHKKYDALLKQRRLISNFPFENSEVFNSKIFAEDFTEARGKVIDSLLSNFYIQRNIASTGIDEILMQLFQSTTDKNYKLRTIIMDSYPERYIPKTTPEKNNETLTELNKLFDTIDRDKNAENFVRKIVKSDVPIKNIKELNEIFERIPAVKLNMFSKNAENILNQTTRNAERLSLLEKEIENPFFETKKARESRKSAEKYGFAKPKNFISRVITRLVNNFKIAQYKRLNIVEPKPDIKPIIETPAAEIKPEVQKTKIDSKEEVRKNIFEILTSKLGEKTFAKQREAYGKGATKMRLGMLPEIFSSIADTRKADRAVGKHRINSSNKDALDLYLLINGSNKKYVNYLLKKRNVDNSRMFEVKDIISMVKKAEAKIAEDKKINPEYRARDARKYYNHLYEAKLEQYGKAARQSKVNTKA